VPTTAASESGGGIVGSGAGFAKAFRAPGISPMRMPSWW
jgi:hypothetical protein